MVGRIQIAPYSSFEELKKRYRQASNGIERSHYQMDVVVRCCPVRLERPEFIQGLTGFHGWMNAVA